MYICIVYYVVIVGFVTLDVTLVLIAQTDVTDIFCYQLLHVLSLLHRHVIENFTL